MKFSRIFTLVALVFFFWLVYRERLIMSQFVVLISSFSIFWLLLIVALVLTYYWVYSLMIGEACLIMDHRSRPGQNYRTSFIIVTLNLAIPTAGLAGVIPLKKMINAAGNSSTIAVVSFILITGCNFLVTMLLVIVTPLILHFNFTGLYREYYLALYGVLWLLLIGLLLLLWAIRRSGRLNDIIRHVIRHPKNLARLLLGALFNNSIAIVLLALILMALGASVQLPAVVIGYSIMALVWYISPTPQGIGVVESVGAVTLMRLGQPAAIAFSAPLIYRGFIQWLPALIGLVAMRRRGLFARIRK